MTCQCQKTAGLPLLMGGSSFGVLDGAALSTARTVAKEVLDSLLSVTSWPLLLFRGVGDVFGTGAVPVFMIGGTAILERRVLPYRTSYSTSEKHYVRVVAHEGAFAGEAATNVVAIADAKISDIYTSYAGQANDAIESIAPFAVLRSEKVDYKKVRVTVVHNVQKANGQLEDLQGSLRMSFKR